MGKNLYLSECQKTRAARFDISKMCGGVSCACTVPAPSTVSRWGTLLSELLAALPTTPAHTPATPSTFIQNYILFSVHPISTKSD